MSTYVSANLLASYLTAAIRQAAEGSELSHRSRWAIAHARRQLEGERDVLAGSKPVTERSVGAALRTSSAASGPSLAAVVLRAAPKPDGSIAAGREEIEARAAAHLTQVLDDLAVLWDRPDRDAVQRLAGAFDAPVRAAA